MKLDIKKIFLSAISFVIFASFAYSLNNGNGGISFHGAAKKNRAEFHLTSAEVISLNDDGITWVKMPNMVGVEMVGFSSAGGTLTKTLSSGAFLMNGVSDLSVNLASKIYYGLALNGSIVPSEVTPHTFAAPSKVANISITAIAQLSVGDTIEIWAKGDGTNSVQITADKLDVTFWGE